MTTAIEDPDRCLLCGRNRATTFGFCAACHAATDWHTDPPQQTGKP